MNLQEYNQWKQWMRASRGQWTLDPIHNGQQGQTLLIFRPSPKDSTKGLFIAVDKTGLVTAGAYRDGSPHVAEGVFFTYWQRQTESLAAGVEFVKNRLSF